ncbi:hypothetical protein BH09PAT1_BH09PAT1_0090 [soil metagenome]
MFLLPENSWEIRQTGHGRAVFTLQEILPGRIIGDYLGPLVADKDEKSHGNGNDHFYTMYYEDDISVEPSGDIPGIHILNHSCTPNTWMYTYHGHTLYFALRKIFADEELTVSYQISPVDEECNPCEHLCTCGSMICKGTMHLSQEQYDKWLELEGKEDKATPLIQKQSAGQTLQKLDFYPEILLDHPIYTLFANPKQEPLIDKATILPTLDEVRLLLRDSGRPILFPNLGLKIHGIYNEHLIADPTTM